MKLLLAEDDIDFGNILSQYLAMSGFEVTLARNGREAWEKFNSALPDICVLDIMMPRWTALLLQKNSGQRNLEFHLFSSLRKA